MRKDCCNRFCHAVIVHRYIIERMSALEKPLLVLDYSVDMKSGENISRWFSCSTAVVRIADGSLFPDLVPWDFKAVIHSGSALSIVDDCTFSSGACSFIERCSSEGVPQMGICYGHQLLAKAMAGSEAVGKAQSLEAGWLPVEFLETWPQKELRGTKRVWQSHYDCVTAIPEGSVITATNEHTEIQAFLNMELKLFGTQFHPEFDRESGNRCFQNDPELFEKNGIDLNSILQGGPDFNTGEVIFSHFIKTFGVE